MADQTSKLSPQQRQSNFNQMTRQHWKSMPALTPQSLDTPQIQFQLPKVRLTSNVRLEIGALLNVKHATANNFLAHDFAPYTLIDSIRLEANNGFAPFTISGQELYAYSLMNDNAFTLSRASSGRGRTVMPTVASAAGADNKARFLVELPLTLNKRDAIGLVLTQNQETTVTITINFAPAIRALAAPDGYTAKYSGISVIPNVEAYSVPAHPDALPDISVLKIVQMTSQPITQGVNQLKLSPGMTFRKLAFIIKDANGNAITDDQILADFELVFNQADIPYSIKPSTLAAINHQQFGLTLPNGLWAFDFSDNGTVGYGGARDYIDTERLTEFWLRFTSPVQGTVTAVYEMLSRMK